MSKYAVILFADEDKPGQAVATLRAVDTAVYEHYASRGVYFVRFPGTAQQLAERLGFATDHGARRELSSRRKANTSATETETFGTG